MTSNDQFAHQLSMFKDLLEAHVNPIREDLRAIRNDIRIDVAAIRTDVADAKKTASDAHRRIDAYDNRIWGISLTGGGLASLIFLVLKALWP